MQSRVRGCQFTWATLQRTISVCVQLYPLLFWLNINFISRRHICSVLLPVSSHRLPPSLPPHIAVSRARPGKSLRLRLLQTAESVLPVSHCLTVQLLPTEAAQASLALRGARGRRSHGLSARRPELQTERGQPARDNRWVSVSVHPGLYQQSQHSGNIDQQQLYTLRNFKLKGKKIINRGDSVKSRSRTSLNSRISRWEKFEDRQGQVLFYQYLQRRSLLWGVLSCGGTN